MTAVHVAGHALVVTDAGGQRHVVLLACQGLAQYHVRLVQLHKLLVQFRVVGIHVWVNLAETVG